MLEQLQMEYKYVKDLEREAKFHARGLRIPEGATESFIGFALKDIPKAVLKSQNEAEIRRYFIKNLDKYHKNLAYVLKNYQNVL